MTDLTLITPTCDRPMAFAICERWMQRSLSQLPAVSVQWIVADDGTQPVTCHLGQLHLQRSPSVNRKESFRGNLLTALGHVTSEKLLFIEDDDWYAADYLSWMSQQLDEAALVGESRARYYNLASRRYHQCGNRRHASLCQTGIRESLIAPLINFLKRHATPFVDLHLWKTLAANHSRRLFPSSDHSVGIKGLPGRQGLGMGHRLNQRHRSDPDGNILRQWVGEADAKFYETLIGSSRDA